MISFGWNMHVTLPINKTEAKADEYFVCVCVWLERERKKGDNTLHGGALVASI